MKIKVGDNVKVLSGRDKGKTGKVVQVLVRRSLKREEARSFVVVEAVNVRKKHLRASRGKKGQTIELPAPIDMSNVMVIDSTGKPTRVGYKQEGTTKKRIAKRSQEFL